MRLLKLDEWNDYARRAHTSFQDIEGIDTLKRFSVRELRPGTTVWECACTARIVIRWALRSAVDETGRTLLRAVDEHGHDIRYVEPADTTAPQYALYRSWSPYLPFDGIGVFRRIQPLRLRDLREDQEFFEVIEPPTFIPLEVVEGPLRIDDRTDVLLGIPGTDDAVERFCVDGYEAHGDTVFLPQLKRAAEAD